MADEKVDRLSTFPLACGVCRRLLGDGTTLYRDWATDPHVFSSSFIESRKRYGADFVGGMMDLSVIASDLGADVRMNDQNTPFVDGHNIRTLEDYERLEIPEIGSGRAGVLIEGTRQYAEALGREAFCSTFIEGPLLALSQTAGAEQLFMDMFTDPRPIHKALRLITEYESGIVEEFSRIDGLSAIFWNYLWGNYSCLSDSEYAEFEADVYAKELNDLTRRNGLAVAVHNCADLPHLDTQIRGFKASVYSHAYYPQVHRSLTASEMIDKGYCDDCLVAGQIDPQIFMRGTVEETLGTVRDLCQNVKTSLCKRGLNSRYTISTGCEIPPGLGCRMDNIQAMVDAVRLYGNMYRWTYRSPIE